MRVGVIGCGRWGTCIAWYLDRIGNEVTLCGRPGSKSLEALINTRRNEYIEIPESIALTDDKKSLFDKDVIIISVGSQELRALLKELAALSLGNANVVFCMKGLEIGTGDRLTQIAEETFDASVETAVWIGPGHVQDLYAGIPACMVIDGKSAQLKQELAESFSSDLIRIYTGNDLIGNEIGAAAKNVIGIAGGVLDGLGWHSLKGALMARGAQEVSRLIRACSGKELSAYGLCHLGDYEATLFSPYSHNRRFGESLVSGERFDKLAEGYYTAAAINLLSRQYGVDMPICSALYRVLYENADAETELTLLFRRSLKTEFRKQ